MSYVVALLFNRSLIYSSVPVNDLNFLYKGISFKTPGECSNPLSDLANVLKKLQYVLNALNGTHMLIRTRSVISRKFDTFTASSQYGICYLCKIEPK